MLFRPAPQKNAPPRTSLVRTLQNYHGCHCGKLVCPSNLLDWSRAAQQHLHSHIQLTANMTDTKKCTFYLCAVKEIFWEIHDDGSKVLVVLIQYMCLGVHCTVNQTFERTNSGYRNTLRRFFGGAQNLIMVKLATRTSHPKIIKIIQKIRPSIHPGPAGQIVFSNCFCRQKMHFFLLSNHRFPLVSKI